MLRELMVDDYVVVRSDFKAAANVNTGMGVVLDTVNGTFAPAATATDDDVYFVNRDRSVTASNAYKTVFSDYDTEFNVISSGEFGILCKYPAGKVIATDQVAAADVNAVANATYLVAGNGGTWQASGNSGADKTRFKYAGTYNDASHTLYKIITCEK